MEPTNSWNLATKDRIQREKILSWIVIILLVVVIIIAIWLTYKEIKTLETTIDANIATKNYYTAKLRLDQSKSKQARQINIENFPTVKEENYSKTAPEGRVGFEAINADKGKERNTDDKSKKANNTTSTTSITSSAPTASVIVESDKQTDDCIGGSCSYISKKNVVVK